MPDSVADDGFMCVLRERPLLRRRMAAILYLHTDVSVRACTSLRPFVITSKEKGLVAELLDTVAKHRFIHKISVLSE